MVGSVLGVGVCRDVGTPDPEDCPQSGPKEDDLLQIVEWK